jgi:aspartate/methionine/tyrosine aminotransferase
MDAQTGFEWVRPEAGVVCLPRLKPGIEVDPEALYRRLAEEYRTFVVPGRCFEMNERFFRIGFGADAEEVRAGLSNLNRALDDLK